MSGGIDSAEEESLSFQFVSWPLVITWSKSREFIMGFASSYVSTLQSLVAVNFVKE